MNLANLGVSKCQSLLSPPRASAIPHVTCTEINTKFWGCDTKTGFTQLAVSNKTDHAYTLWPSNSMSRYLP